MYTKKLESSELGDIVYFDMAPVITTTDKHYISSYVKGKKYPATLTTTEFLKEMMKDIFRKWFGKAFEEIIDYYDDIKWVEDNQDYHVIRGKIRLKEQATG